MKLIVGTESTWSLRAMICGYLSDTQFSLEIIDLAKPKYSNEILKYSHAGLVPILDTGTVVIHDSLAIAEYFNEISEGSLLPSDPESRAVSRSLCSELHAGFLNFRQKCPFTLGSVEKLRSLDVDLSKELSRIEHIFSKAILPFMFAEPGVIDAFYSVLAYRLKIYGIHLNGVAGQYQSSLVEWPLLIKAIGELNA